MSSLARSPEIYNLFGEQVLIETDRDKDGAVAFISGHGTYQVCPSQPCYH